MCQAQRVTQSGVDVQRTNSKSERRRLILGACKEHLISGSGSGDAQRLKKLINGGSRTIVTGGDIDGLVSAQMLSSVTGWRVGAVVWGDEASVHPDLLNRSGTWQGFDDAANELFLIDLFSPQIPGVSNHPVLWGRRHRGSNKDFGDLAKYFDDRIKDSLEGQLLGCPSLWVGIEGSLAASGDADKETALQYKYPLGTAQILLALLEAAEYPPMLADREYLPWLIAHCDGGLNSLRQYHWNASLWWSMIAGCIGPQSRSELIYRVATECLPLDFVKLDRQLKHEEADAKEYLDENWNLAPSGDPSAFRSIVALVERLSGWDDPLEGGAENLPEWKKVKLERGGLRSQGSLGNTDTEIQKELVTVSSNFDDAFNALSMGFTQFSEFKGLAWTMPWWANRGTGS